VQQQLHGLAQIVWCLTLLQLGWEATLGAVCGSWHSDRWNQCALACASCVDACLEHAAACSSADVQQRLPTGSNLQLYKQSTANCTCTVMRSLYVNAFQSRSVVPEKPPLVCAPLPRYISSALWFC
jgi:hypothetical protein